MPTLLTLYAMGKRLTCGSGWLNSSRESKLIKLSNDDDVQWISTSIYTLSLKINKSDQIFKTFEVNIVAKLESLIGVFNLHHPVVEPRDDRFDYQMSNSQ